MWVNEWLEWIPSAGVDVDSVEIAWLNDREFTIFYTGLDPEAEGQGALWSESGTVVREDDGREVMFMSAAEPVKIQQIPDGSGDIISVERADGGGFLIHVEVPSPL